MGAALLLWKHSCKCHGGQRRYVPKGNRLTEQTDKRLGLKWPEMSHWNGKCEKHQKQPFQSTSWHAVMGWINTKKSSLLSFQVFFSTHLLVDWPIRQRERKKEREGKLNKERKREGKGKMNATNQNLFHWRWQIMTKRINQVKEEESPSFLPFPLLNPSISIANLILLPCKNTTHLNNPLTYGLHLNSQQISGQTLLWSAATKTNKLEMQVKTVKWENFTQSSLVDTLEIKYREKIIHFWQTSEVLVSTALPHPLP